MLRVEVWSLGAIQARAESGYLCGLLAGLAGGLGSSLARYLDDEIRVLAHTVCKQHVGCCVSSCQGTWPVAGG